jgi:hypothetical protein
VTMSERRELGRLRGHAIYRVGKGPWRFYDTNERTEDTWRSRSCGHCGLPPREDEHDPCHGELPGVDNACCGHGDISTAYVQFNTGETLRREAALEKLAAIVEARAHL